MLPHQPPPCSVERGEEGIRPLHRQVHFRDQQAVGLWQEGAVDRLAADAVEAGVAGGLGHVDGGLGAGGGELAQGRVARDDDVEAVLQRLDGQAFPGAAAHDERAARGFALEEREVFGGVPRDVTGFADGAVAGAGDDQGQHRKSLSTPPPAP